MYKSTGYIPFRSGAVTGENDLFVVSATHYSARVAERLAVIIMCSWCVSVVSVYPDHDVGQSHVCCQQHHPGRRDGVGLSDLCCRGYCCEWSSFIVFTSETQIQHKLIRKIS